MTENQTSWGIYRFPKVLNISWSFLHAGEHFIRCTTKHSSSITVVLCSTSLQKNGVQPTARPVSQFKSTYCISNMTKKQFRRLGKATTHLGLHSEARQQTHILTQTIFLPEEVWMLIFSLEDRIILLTKLKGMDVRCSGGEHYFSNKVSMSVNVKHEFIF